jgi:short-subunit dehydrogenase
MESEGRLWALVTGATGGIGREFSALLSRSGWRLVLAGRNEERLAAARAALEGPRAGEAVALTADLSKHGAAERLAAACAERGIEVELLVNNAGLGIFGPSVEIPCAEIEAMIALNVTSLTCLCAVFGRSMRERGRGMILNVGSFAGNQATPYFASYAASKSYVLSYSLALRAELASSGVRVSCLLPGYVRTGFDEAAGIESAAYRAFSTRNSLDAGAVARIGLACMERNRPYVIAGARNKIAALAMGLLPRTAPPAIMKSFLDRLIG